MDKCWDLQLTFYMYLKETICILILIPLEFVLNGPMKKDSSGLSKGLVSHSEKPLFEQIICIHVICIYASPSLKLIRLTHCGLKMLYGDIAPGQYWLR